MAIFQISQAQSNPVSLVGINVIPMTCYDWDVFALAPTAIAADVIYTPILDLNQVNPNCNRVNFQKLSGVAAADTMTIQMSADGVFWYTAPLYNGGTAGGTATSATSIAELSLVGLPAMRYIRGSCTLAVTAMSARTSMHLALSLLRY